MAEGKFVGRDEHSYRVEFTGNDVPADVLTIAGVTISMEAGDRKFVGFKSTTCKVSVLTDRPMLWAYARGAKAIEVEVVDETSSERVFVGYVVPFTFEQSYTGTADVVTIDCVDCITASKDALYRSSEDDTKYGIDVPADAVVEDVISHAGGRDKVREVVYHCNFDQVGGSGAGKTFDLMVAQAGFLQDGMTALDAMNALCIFCGYTAAMVGDKLMMWDEHCLTHADEANARNVVVEKWQDFNGEIRPTSVKKFGELRTVTVGDGGMPMRNDLTVSVERAYDGVQLKPSGRAVSVLLPNVCAEENVIANTDGRGTAPQMVGGDNYREYRQPVQSKVMEFGTFSAPSALTSPTWRNNAMLVSLRHYDLDDDGYTWGGGDPETVIWLRGYDAQEAVYGMPLYRYSHTNGMVQLNMKCRFVVEEEKDEYLNLTNAYNLEGENMAVNVVQLKVGDQYLVNPYINPTEYSSIPYQTFLLTKSGEPIGTYAAQANWSGEYMAYISDNNQVGVELQFVYYNTIPEAFPRPIMGELFSKVKVNMIITQLELVGVGDDVWEGHWDMRHEYVDNARDMLEVSVGLTTRQSGQAHNPDNRGYVYGWNARPGVVTDSVYPCGGYMGGEQTTCPMGGIVMRQLKERYGEPHLRYSVTVDGRVMPTDTVVFAGVKYTVEGYERDLVTDTTRIIID